MQFFIQNKRNNCQIIALQIVLSHYNLFPAQKEISEYLPKHSYGNLITELGIYLESQGIKTKLVSNGAIINPKDTYFNQTLDEYKKVGDFEDRDVRFSDLTNNPVIVNVDLQKITSKVTRQAPHYVVLISEKHGLYFYEGSHHTEPVKVSFQDVINASMNINRRNEDGMWLFTL